MKFATTIKPVSVNRRSIPGQHGKLITSSDYRNTKYAMHIVFRNQYKGEPFGKNLRIKMVCGWKNFDIDGWIKIVLDALEGVAYRSDKQIKEMFVVMTDNKKIEIEVGEI